MTGELRRVDVRLPLRRPWRGLLHRDVTLVEGVAGWGESSPIPGYPVAASTCAAAAIEAAMLGLPDPVRDRVPVNAVIADTSVDVAVAAAVDAVDRGFATIKIKVGDADDLVRVREIRAAVGPAPNLRLDANGAWGLDDARRRLHEFGALDVEFVEEPVAGLDAMARLRPDVAVPIAADESVRHRDDVARVAAGDVVDVLVVKVQASGGALRALHWAEDAGLPVVVTSMIETSIGLSAGLALAAALPALPLACGLGTADLLAADVVDDPLIPVDGALEVRRPVPSADLLERYEVEVGQ